MHNLSRLTAAPRCSKETCESGLWTLWSRRSTGVVFNDQWFCSARCMRAALEMVVGNSALAVHRSTISGSRLPFGLLMLSRGVIDEEQLRAALNLQDERPGIKVGECLKALGAVRSDDIIRALGAQQCLPVLLTFAPEPSYEVPVTLLKASRCIAFHSNRRAERLYIGFEAALDRSLLAAAERVLGVQCEPCIVDAEIVARYLESKCKGETSEEVVFDTKTSSVEIVRCIHSYALQVRAEVIRTGSTGQYLWVRLSGSRRLDLLFRTSD